MYRVLLVDDEPMSLVSLKHAFNWSKYDFDVVYQTTNPSEAFEKISTEEFDVVFTDIRMPKISGLDLIKKAGEAGIKTTFIIVSGYGEFNYAQQALREGVFDYCLKPVSPENAEELLSRLSVYLNSRQDNYDINTYNMLINGLLDINEFMSMYSFKPSNRYYQAVCLLLQEPGINFKNEELFPDNVNKIQLRLASNKSIYILNLDSDISDKINNLSDTDMFTGKLSIGFSSNSEDASQLASLLKESDIAANTCFITGLCKSYKYIKSDFALARDLAKDLTAALDYMRTNSLKDLMDNAAGTFAAMNLGLEDAVYLWNQLVSHLTNKYGVNELPKDFEFLNYSEVTARFKSFTRMCDYLEELFFSVANISQGIPENVDINDSFKKLIDHVNQNYCSDISMKELSNMFHINYTYCCELFKKVMGITFSEYITGLRMKKAMNLLENSNLSIEKVAMETGFSDYYYFNNVFKKHYNITPSKYRKSGRN